MTSEIYPLDVRAAAVSITTAANWSGNFVVAMLTPILIASPLQIHGTFYLLSVCLLAAFLFVLFSLPETKVSTRISVCYRYYATCAGLESGENRHSLRSILEKEN